ncbi:MAG: GGDEF domain-containing protein [Lautropia sp.]
MSGPLLDPSTLSVAASAMSLLLAAALFHVAAHAPATFAVRPWGRSCVVAAVGFALKAFDSAAAPNLAGALGDLALTAALILQAIALSDLTRHGERIVRTLVIVNLAHLVVVIQFALLDPSPLTRIVASQLIGAIGLIAASLLGWRPSRPEFRRIGPGIGAIYLAAGLLMLAAGVVHWQTASVAIDEIAVWSQLGTTLLQLMLPLALIALACSHLARQLARSATRDALTQAANRRGLADAWNLLQARARRGDEGWHVGVVMLDVDHLKSINQSHGHAQGDTVLRIVADAMRSTARRYDTVSRFGGGEFCMLLPGVTIRQAQVVTERIRRQIADASREQTGTEVTVSAGVTVANAGETPMEQAIDAADQMLYLAKRDGRDRARIDPDALRVVAGISPLTRSNKPDALGFPLL